MVIFMTIPKDGKREFAALGLLFLVSLLSDMIGLAGIYLHLNTNLRINIYLLLNLPIIIWIYKRETYGTTANRVLYTIIALYLLFWFLNFFIFQGVHNINSYSSLTTSFCVMVISLWYFYVLIQRLPAESITKLPMFWINTAMLIYYSGTFFIYLSMDYLVNVLKDNLIAIWYIHHLLGLIFYSSLWYAMLLIRSEYLKRSE